MSYIGNPIISTDYPVDYKNGDGSTTVFTLSVAPASVNAIDVQISGVTQSPQTYTVSGTTLTFSAAPPSGTANIVVRHRGIAASANVPAIGSVGLTSFSASGTPSSTTYLRGDNSWATVDSLPSQTGNSGKYLTTNGTAASWGTIASSQWTTTGSDIYYTTGNVGVGTSTPGVKLDVNGGDFRIQQSAATARHRFIAGSNQWNVEASNSSNTFGIYDAAGGYASMVLSGSNLQFNSGYGSVATAYGCRAWVCFNGTNGSIFSSGNVSSVSRNSTGAYTVNFSNAMPDANYAVSGAASTNSGANGPRIFVVGSGQYSNYSKTTTAFNCQSWYTDGNLYDANFVYAVVHR